jgi:hypothetical protein
MASAGVRDAPLHGLRHEIVGHAFSFGVRLGHGHEEPVARQNIRPVLGLDNAQ